MESSVGNHWLLPLPGNTEKPLSEKQRHEILSHFPNVAYNVIGIAASLGGLSAVSKILADLPSDFPAAIVIVQHIAPEYPSYLSYIWSQRTALRVKQAEEGDLLRPGTVYTPVPNKHLVINSDGTLHLSDSEKINFVRPSADKLFRSLANTYKNRAIAIVLTGRDSDGSLGVLTIKKHGGLVIAQDEATSECFSMPKSAINTGKVDLILSVNEVSTTLMTLLMTKIDPASPFYGEA